MRLIDADRLIENIELLAKYEDAFRQSVVLGVAQTIRNAPTVDAVEAVRYSKCKHFGHNMENDTYCSVVNGLSGSEPDDFYSYGERL